jgi:hypothetical protein
MEFRSRGKQDVLGPLFDVLEHRDHWDVWIERLSLSSVLPVWRCVLPRA